ncbi:MAG TPA: TorF family putative porin [Kiritimatiellia bacterium]|nr:TorF family putative porin [Kiritimatiellia bacterium]HRZ12960.1 TorF family putative porin [Kiritimatiellia bacterium]HSA18430.1 TorF family putative porin [Kiritimatiellia bacterium]
MKRNGLQKWMLMAGLVMTAAAGAWGAEASLDLSLNSHYIWRGQVLNDEPVFQPSLTVSGPCGLSFNTWANMDVTDNLDNQGEFNEVDLTVSYSHNLCEKVSLEVGIVDYVLKTAENTGELYLVAGADVLLSPTVRLYYDFDEVQDFYAQLAVGHSMAFLEEKLSLDLGASLGFGGSDYNEYYFTFTPAEGEEGEAIVNDSAALNDLNLSAGLTYAFSETLSLAGNVQYVALLDSDIEDAAEAVYGEKDAVYGGVTLSRSF